MGTLGGILGITYTSPLTGVADKFSGITLLTDGTGDDAKITKVSVVHNAVGSESETEHKTRLKSDGEKVGLSPTVIDGLSTDLNTGADTFTVDYAGDTLDKIASLIGLVNFYITDGDEAKFLEIKQNFLNNYNANTYNKYSRNLVPAYFGGSGNPTIEEDGTVVRINFHKLENPLVTVSGDTTATGTDNGDGTYTISSSLTGADLLKIAIGDLLVVTGGAGGSNVPDGSHPILDYDADTGDIIIGMNNGTWATADPINGSGFGYTIECDDAEVSLEAHKQMVIQPVEDLLGFEIASASWVSFIMDTVYADHFSVELERGTDPRKYEVAHAIAYLLSDTTYNKTDIIYRYILHLLNDTIDYTP